MTPSSTPVLSASGIYKHFPPNVQALEDASIEICPGEVHCLVGANGAGKSTLVKVLAGAHRPDRGVVEVDGTPVTFSKPHDAVRVGISTIFQELDLVPELTVEQNLLLGRTPVRGFVIDRSARRRRAQEALERVGAPFAADVEVGRLSVANQQLAAIARALTTDAKLLVMDEPSAALDDAEVARVFAVIRDLTTTGHSVLFISHRLGEVFDIGDRVTVMRNSRTVGTYDLASTSPAELVAAMIGQHRSLIERHERPDHAGAPVALDLRSLDGPDGLHVDGLQVRTGEIVGLAGLGGAGRTTLLNSLFGCTRATIDADVFGERYAPKSPGDAVDRQVGLVPENRKTEGLILGASIGRNAALPSLRRRRFSTWRRIRELTTPHLDQLNTKYADIALPVRLLSGGNQQKVVLARWLAKDTRLLLLDEPSRGLDVGAKADLYTQVRALADAGAAVLVASSDLEELVANCDRICVIHEGRNVAEFDPDRTGHDPIQQTVITGVREDVA